VFCGLGPVWLRSFSSHETGLPNTTLHYSLSPSYVCISLHTLNLLHPGPALA
ncbi:hypothetical protein K443DRAFT_101550, partial [Laccaria amethystina LaAM-08-1]